MSFVVFTVKCMSKIFHIKCIKSLFFLNKLLKTIWMGHYRIFLEALWEKQREIGGEKGPM